MTLKDYYFKKGYDSDSDDILKEFYIPALQKTQLYRRLSGHFSSSGLAIAARGVCGLIENGGKIELICSSRFTKDDIEMIDKAYTNPETVLELNFINEIEELENLFVRDHVKAFG